MDQLNLKLNPDIPPWHKIELAKIPRFTIVAHYQDELFFRQL